MKTTMSEQNNTTPEPKKDALQVDGLQEAINKEATPLFDFLVKYSKAIFLGAGLLIAIAAGYAGIEAWGNYSENKASEEFAQVLSIQGPERIEALKAFADDAPAQLKGGVLFELAGSLMAMDKFEEAAEVWIELEAQGGEEMKTITGMGLARCLLLAGKTDEAYAKAKDVTAAAPEAMLAPTNRLLAACAEAAGDKAAAAKALQTLLDSGNAVDAPLLSYRIQALGAE
ncbi:MAG: tetratricopeptide repeat protein [Proteobacteria bacterium]|nr:tetratricopeptide repeat protein [Pseudomonadota bacterium]